MDLIVIYTVMRDGFVLGQGELTHTRANLSNAG